jgi:hypothetical protein
VLGITQANQTTRGFKTGHCEEQAASPWRLFPGRKEEAKMPVLIMWAIPTVIVVGGVGYFLVRAIH